MTILSLLTLMVGLATVLALPQNTINTMDTMETCESVMTRNGFNFSTFRHGVAHGIHSIYLEEIRHFFEPDAPDDNNIPVVSADLSAEQMVLFDSPLAGYDTDFKTLALQVMSYFMLNDAPNFYQQGTNTLEKIAHQFHMHEIYAAAVPIYRERKENPPIDPRLCSCVNDIHGNGILAEMGHIAELLKVFSKRPFAEKCPTKDDKWGFDYGPVDFDYKKHAEPKQGPKWGFDYGPVDFDYKKHTAPEQGPKWGFDYGPVDFDYKMNAEPKQGPKWGFDYGPVDFDYKKQTEQKSEPKWGFDYDYKNKKQQTEPKLAAKWGFDYDYKNKKQEAKPVESRMAPKWGFDYDYKNKKQQTVHKLAPKWGFDYDYKNRKQETESEPADPKLAPKWGFDYDYKNKKQETESKLQPKWGFDYGPVDFDYKKQTEPKWGFDYDYKNKKEKIGPKWGFDYGPVDFDYKKTTRCRPTAAVESEASSEMVDQYKKEYLEESTHQTAEKVMNVDPWKPNTLVGPKEWTSYEAMLTYSMLEQEELKDFATFIYCKLNQPV